MLSKTSLLAIRAMAELSFLSENQWVGVGSISRKIHVPRNYLGKVLQSLVDGGMVRSQKGLNGGFSLGKRGKAITLYDIIASIEGVERWEVCLMKQRKCSDVKGCAMHDPLGKTRKAYIHFLKKMTLKDIAK